MIKRISIILLLISSTLILSACNVVRDYLQPDPVTLEVMAVPSLKGPLEELKTKFEQENSYITINYKYLSSHVITEDVISGQYKPNMVILSSQKDMTELSNNSLIASDTRKNLAQNSLVLIAGPESTLTSVTDLANYDVSNVDIGDPALISAGYYAEEVLRNMNLYDSISSKLTHVGSTESIITDVADGNAQAGIVFKSDVTGNASVKIVYEFPVQNYSAITYPMGIIAGSENEGDSTLFEEFLLEPEAQQIFSNYGFTPVSSTQEEDNSQNNTDNTAPSTPTETPDQNTQPAPTPDNQETTPAPDSQEVTPTPETQETTPVPETQDQTEQPAPTIQESLSEEAA